MRMIRDWGWNEDGSDTGIKNGIDSAIDVSNSFLNQNGIDTGIKRGIKNGIDTGIDSENQFLESDVESIRMHSTKLAPLCPCPSSRRGPSFLLRYLSNRFRSHASQYR